MLHVCACVYMCTHACVHVGKPFYVPRYSLTHLPYPPGAEEAQIITRKPVGFMQSCVNFKTAFDYLLMLTIFHVENFLIILDWYLCDFLLLKHINKVHALHVDLSFTDVDYFLCGKYSRISILVLIIYWCWHIFHVQNVLIILNWCLCDFLLLKHINEVDGLQLHLSSTYFCVENILRFQYCFWLFTDVDIFFMCKMFLSFSTDVYVIFCYWNISMKWMDFIFICHWHIFVWKIFYDFNTAFD